MEANNNITPTDAPIDNGNGEVTADQLASQEAAAAALIQEEKQPDPITDEVLFGELSKRYAEKGIKSREDFEKIITSDYSKHIVPKNEVVKKFNDWTGDPETFFKITKMDIDGMDNKAAIIHDIKIKEGMTDKLAELQFNRKYGHAFKDKEDEDFNEEEYELAMHNLNKDGKLAKDSLAQWKASESEKGQQKIDPDAEAKAEQALQENWLKPIQNTLNGLQKLDFNLKLELPDKTVVEEPLSFGVEKSESKKAVEDILSSRTSDEFMAKVLKRYGMSQDGRSADLKGLINVFMTYENLPQIIQQITSVAGSKFLEHHLKNIKPGDLSADKSSGTTKTTSTNKNQNIVEAMNRAATS